MNCENDSLSYLEGFPSEDFRTKIIKYPSGSIFSKSIEGPGFRHCELFGEDKTLLKRYYMNDRGIEMTEYFDKGVCVKTVVRIKCNSGVVEKVLDESGKIISERIVYDD